MALAKILFWLALGTWVGAITFFSFVVAPGVFGALPQESAGQVVGVLFPRYYAFGTVTTSVALIAAVVLWRAAPGKAWAAVTVMVLLMLGATLYAGRVVQPRAQALRSALHHSTVDPGVRSEFDRLHRLAVQLNAAALLLGIASVCVAAANLDLRPPVTGGATAGRSRPA